MIERAGWSVTTVSGLDWTPVSGSRSRASVSKRPGGLSAAPRPLIFACDLSTAFDLDDPAFLEAGYLARVVAWGGEHRRSVLAELRPAPFDVTWRSRELGNDSRDLERRAVIQPDLPDHVASQVLRVARDVGHAVDLAARHLGRIQRSDDIIGVVFRGPLADHGIELIAAPGAPRVVGKRWVVRQILPPDHLHQALEDAVGIGSDHDVLSVARQVGVRRHDSGQVAAGALARLPEKVVLRQ